MSKIKNHLSGTCPQVPTRTKQLVRFPTIDLPCVNFLTEISPGPALAVFAFRGLRTLKQKHRSGLQAPYAGKAVCLLPD